MRARTIVPVLALVGALAPVAPAAAASTCGGRPATIVGNSRPNVIDGTPGNDVIIAGDGNDVVRGNGGDDRICGGRGADNLYGGPGADRMSGGPGADRMFGGADAVFINVEGDTERVGDFLSGDKGRDRLVPGVDTRLAGTISPDALSWRTSPRGVRIDLEAGVTTGIDPDSFAAAGAVVYGSAYADVVLGSDGDDQIFSEAGADEVRSRGGKDYVLGGLGNDLVDGGAGNDDVRGETGRDRVFGGPGNDEVRDDEAGADRLYGMDGDDLITAQFFLRGPAKALYGGAGQDTLTLYGGGAARSGTWDMRAGPVRLVGAGTQVESETGGFEVGDVNTPGVTWVITGTEGADDVTVLSPGSRFDGLGGDDTFGGWFFDDVFRGGPGSDRGMMRDGVDTCVSVEVPTDCENVTP